MGVRTGTSNFMGNLRSLLTFSNNILQGDIKSAGNTAGRFAINTTVGILGIFDPASKMGFEKISREDFGQTLGVWGADTGCYFVLPVLGPTTTRDAVGLVGNVFIDPVYHLTHGSETDIVVGNENVGEHNYYIYKGTDAVDFRSKNIESIDSLEKNEFIAPPHLLKWCTKHPQPKHIKKNVSKISVHEHMGERLPEGKFGVFRIV